MPIAKRWVAGIALAAALPFAANAAYADEIPQDGPTGDGSFASGWTNLSDLGDPFLPDYFPDLGRASTPSLPDTVATVPDTAFLQAADVGGVAVTDVGMLDLPGAHPILPSGLETAADFPASWPARFRTAELANGHVVYEAIYHFFTTGVASPAATQFRSYLAAHTSTPAYAVVSTDQAGAGSTVATRGTDAYAVGPAGQTLVVVLDVAPAGGTADAAAVAALGKKAIERAAAALPDGATPTTSPTATPTATVPAATPATVVPDPALPATTVPALPGAAATVPPAAAATTPPAAAATTLPAAPAAAPAAGATAAPDPAAGAAGAAGTGSGAGAAGAAGDAGAAGTVGADPVTPPNPGTADLPPLPTDASVGAGASISSGETL